ncbi:MAG: EamA/RhaT family transporter, partial [Caulobacterales bacterium]
MTSATTAPRAGISILLWGYVAAALGAAFFATKAIFVKLAYRHGVDAETFLALRMLLSGPVFAAVGIWAWRRREIPVTRAQFCGACGVGLLG